MDKLDPSNKNFFRHFVIPKYRYFAIPKIRLNPS